LVAIDSGVAYLPTGIGPNSLRRTEREAAVIYIKSILAGFVAFVLTVFLYGLAIIGYIRFYLLPKLPRPPHGEIGFDLSSMGIRFWPALILATIAFAAAFYRMLRWSTARQG
jgi:hypothetical protein